MATSFSSRDTITHSQSWNITDDAKSTQVIAIINDCIMFVLQNVSSTLYAKDNTKHLPELLKQKIYSAVIQNLADISEEHAVECVQYCRYRLSFFCDMVDIHHNL